VINRLACWEIWGIVFVIVAGTLLHFVYDWSGHNRLVGIFSPVNESIWEHLKLLFVPMLLFSAVEYFEIGKYYPNFIAAKSFGMVIGMFAIIVAFYTYTGIIGEHFLWADILTFIFGVVVAYAYSWRAINQGSLLPQSVGIMLTIVLAMCFILFTFHAPHIALFLDPVSKKYGISHQ
jgi:hypothetical protein